MKIKEREKYVKHQKNMIKKFNSCVNLAKKEEKFSIGKKRFMVF
jgi:hypothetical protein